MSWTTSNRARPRRGFVRIGRLLAPVSGVRGGVVRGGEFRDAVIWGALIWDGFIRGPEVPGPVPRGSMGKVIVDIVMILSLR